jgi:predicted phosphodiesterase
MTAIQILSDLHLEFYKKLPTNICNDHFPKAPTLFLVGDIGYPFDDIWLKFIEWCESNLNFIENKIFISGNLDYQDLYLMSMCNHNIIANSSFSWWGAWLNNHNNKKVIFPSLWFNNGINTSEIGGENWIKI